MHPASDMGAPDFHAQRGNADVWQGLLTTIARIMGESSAVPIADGTVLVARLGESRILKVYPAFLRDHHDFERGMLERLEGRLSVPTPELLAEGEHEGWRYLVMTKLSGGPLTTAWPELDERQRCALLASIGCLAAEVHALPIGDQAVLAPPWSEFLERQRLGCVDRQSRTGLPEQLLRQVPDFIRGEVPEGPSVLLTGEYTPVNLFVEGGGLSGMFDFGDGLVGPREYDWLGPLCFLAAGHAGRVRAFLEGYGAEPTASWKLPLMRLLLLHRYSHLRLQIAHEGWSDAASFEVLAARIWP